RRIMGAPAAALHVIVVWITARPWSASPFPMQLLAGLFGFGSAVAIFFGADQLYLGKQLRHLHAGERLKQGRNLGSHGCHVAGDLAGSGSGSVAGGHNGDLVHVGQRLGHGPHHFGHVGDELIHHCSLVPPLVRFGFHVHGLGFSLAFLEDDLGFSFTLHANGLSLAFSLGDLALLLGFRDVQDPLLLDFSLLEHGGDQFFLMAHDLGFLHLDLLLFLDLLHLDLLSHHLLLRDVLLQLVGFVGLRLLALHGFSVVGFLDIEV